MEKSKEIDDLNESELDDMDSDVIKKNSAVDRDLNEVDSALDVDLNEVDSAADTDK